MLNLKDWDFVLFKKRKKKKLAESALFVLFKFPTVPIYYPFILGGSSVII